MKGRKGLGGGGDGYEGGPLRAMGMFVRALCFALLCFGRKDSEVVVENFEGEGGKR